MLLVPCVHCGPRPETEFRCGGQAHIVRPERPSELSDQEWMDVLFTRANPKGLHAERWLHIHGCGQWFNAVRDTVSDKFITSYKTGEPRPEIAP